MLFLTFFPLITLFLVLLCFDIKYRKVPNKVFKLGFGIAFILNIFEYLICFNNFMVFIFGKFFFS